MITRRALLARYGNNRNIAALARVSESAVRCWPLDQAIPSDKQMIFAFFIDPAYWQNTLAHYSHLFFPFRGIRDGRIDPRFLPHPPLGS
ncbi:hypothetical protein [Dyella japonica]|uniref:Uncharacterized protein n=1 Tax=Dyella japonica TaxID=231455 RepID=A0ABV2K0V1_9GAMM